MGPVGQFWSAAGSAHQPSAAVSPDDGLQIASEAFVYTYPFALMDITRRVSINFDAGARPASYWE